MGSNNGRDRLLELWAGSGSSVVGPRGRSFGPQATGMLPPTVRCNVQLAAETQRLGGMVTSLLFALFVSFLGASSASAATRYSVATGNWNSTSTWSATSGGPPGASVPAAGDTVTIEGGFTVQMNVAVTQTAAGSVTVNSGSTLSATTTGVSHTLGALTINSGGTVTLYRNTTVLGATSITGQINFGSTSATVRTMTFTGPVTLNGGANWNETTAGAAAIFNFSNSLTNDATTFTAQAPLHTFNGAGTLSGATNSVIPSVTFTANYTNSGTLTVATALAVTGAAIQLTNDGTITATTALSGTGGVTQGATGTLNIGGTSGITTLTATNSGNTVNYTGAAQTVHTGNYFHLTLSGSGAKTLQVGTTTIGGNLTLRGTATTATVGALTVTGNLDIGNGTTFNAAAAAGNLLVTGTTTVGGGTTGTLTISNRAGTKTFVGLVTVNAGANWNETVNEAITFRGGITNNGTFTAGTAVHTFNTNSQALTGTFSIPRVTVNGVTLTNNNTLTVGTALSGTGGLTQAANATLNIGGTSGITTLTTTNSGNTVNYTGAAQTVHTGNYFHLTLSGSGAKTLQTGTTTIGGNLTLSGTASTTAVVGLGITGNVTLGSGTGFTAGAFTHTVGGDWTNNGATFTAGTSTLTFSRTGAQAIAGSSATTFNNLIFSGSGAKSMGPTGTAVSGNLSISGSATASVNAGLNLSVNTLALGGNTARAGMWGSTSSAATYKSDTYFAATNGILTVASGTAVADKLAFTTQPGGGKVNVAWTTQPKVEVQDAFGYLVTTGSYTVTVAIQTNPSGGTLSGTANEATVLGVADFAGNGLQIDTSGRGYTLRATSAPALTQVDSSPFDIYTLAWIPT
jgi:hypothetical protein